MQLLLSYLSPEFRKYLWLKFTPFKLVVPPVLAFLLLSLLGEGASSHVGASGIQTFALLLYYIAVIVIGTFEAAASLQSEVKNKTWDLQRLSGQRPWALALGKLFGAACYSWCFGLWMLIVYGASAYIDGGFYSFTWGRGGVLGTALMWLLLGVMAHVLALYFVAGRLRKVGGRGGASGRADAGGVVFPFVQSFVLVNVALMMAQDLGKVAGAFMLGSVATPTSWYGLEFGHGTGLGAFVWGWLYVIIWGAVALWRYVRAQMGERNSGLVWFIFVAVSAVCMAGFAPAEHRLVVAFVAFLLGAYKMAWFELDGNAKYLAAFGRRLAARDWGRALRDMPAWIAPALGSLVLWVCVVVGAYGRYGFGDAGTGVGADLSGLALDGSSGISSTLERLEPLRELVTGDPFSDIFIASFSAIFLAARDIIALHAILMNYALRRQGAFIVFAYFTFMYFALPFVHSAYLGVWMLEHWGLASISFYYPLNYGPAWAVALGYVVQVGIAAGALWVSVVRGRKAV